MCLKKQKTAIAFYLARRRLAQILLDLALSAYLYSLVSASHKLMAVLQSFVHFMCVLLQSGYFPGAFIVSSGPHSNNEDLFWEMILVKKCQIVVAMENLVRPYIW